MFQENDIIEHFPDTVVKTNTVNNKVYYTTLSLDDSNGKNTINTNSVFNITGGSYEEGTTTPSGNWGGVSSRVGDWNGFKWTLSGNDNPLNNGYNVYTSTPFHAFYASKTEGPITVQLDVLNVNGAILTTSLIKLDVVSPNKPNTPPNTQPTCNDCENIFELIFKYAYLYAIVAAIFCSINEYTNIDVSDYIEYPSVILAGTVFFTISSIISLLDWFNIRIPYLVPCLFDPKYVNTTLNNSCEKY